MSSELLSTENRTISSGEKRRSEEVKKNLNLRLKPADDDHFFSETSSNLTINKKDPASNSYEIVSKPEEIFKNPLKPSKDQNISAKPMQSPFTMFCKGLELSPAYQAFASPFNFGSSAFSFRGGNDIIRIPSPSPLPFRPLHEVDASMETKKHMTKLNFDNCLLMFNAEQDETATESNYQTTKLSEGPQSVTSGNNIKSPFFSLQSPKFDFMKKSIYAFPIMPQIAQAKNNEPQSIQSSAQKTSESPGPIHEGFANHLAQNPLSELLLLSHSHSSIKTSENNSSKENEGIQESSSPGKVCCNCKKSRCLKLYCDCFARGEYCKGDCNCVQCLNTKESEMERQAAMAMILQKNPNAFKPKVDATLNIAQKVRHSTGCNCKRSGCQKKYCECYQAGVECSEVCKCENCRNSSHSACRKKAKRPRNFVFNTEERIKTTSRSMETEDREDDDVVNSANPSKRLLMEKTSSYQRSKAINFFQEDLGDMYQTGNEKQEKQSRKNAKVF